MKSVLRSESNQLSKKPPRSSGPLDPVRLFSSGYFHPDCELQVWHKLLNSLRLCTSGCVCETGWAMWSWQFATAEDLKLCASDEQKSDTFSWSVFVTHMHISLVWFAHRKEKHTNTNSGFFMQHCALLQNGAQKEN